MSTYRCMLRPTWTISALQHKSKYKSKFNFELFWKKIKFLGSHVVVLVKTFPLTYQLLMQDWYWRSQGDFFSRHTETRSTDRIQFRQFWTFWKFFTFLGFHGVVLVKTIPLMYQYTNVGLILTKQRWKVISALCQKSKFEFRTFFKKKIKFLGFHGVVLVKTIPLMCQLLM